jgi:hypothetical protein
MRIHEYAKARQLPSKEVSDAAEVLNFKKTNPASGLNDAQVEQLDAHFRVSAGSGRPTPDEEAAAADATSGVKDLSIYPSRLYKYAKRRKLRLEDVLQAARSIGLDDVKRHRAIDSGIIRRLDDFFRTKGKKGKK